MGKLVFVVGGPGAGKGTQCAKIKEEFGWIHLSAGDLLRKEVADVASETGRAIKAMMQEGQIVPQEVTIGLLKAEMERNPECPGFLIDGFPRTVEQGQTFEQTVAAAAFVLSLDTDEATMEKRLLSRGESSGRADDNIESIRKRFVVHQQLSEPVVAHFESTGRVKRVDSGRSESEVYADVRQFFL